jgi:hypothetical protein
MAPAVDLVDETATTSNRLDPAGIVTVEMVPVGYVVVPEKACVHEPEPRGAAWDVICQPWYNPIVRRSVNNDMRETFSFKLIPLILVLIILPMVHSSRT